MYTQQRQTLLDGNVCFLYEWIWTGRNAWWGTERHILLEKHIRKHIGLHVSSQFQNFLVFVTPFSTTRTMFNPL